MIIRLFIIFFINLLLILKGKHSYISINKTYASHHGNTTVLLYTFPPQSFMPSVDWRGSLTLTVLNGINTVGATTAMVYEGIG